jgi:hypothetical protein
MKGESSMFRERPRFLKRLLMGSLSGVLALVLGLWAYGSFANTASLSVSPSPARQNDRVTLIGKGFQPGETVSVWITYPDFRVFGVAQVSTNGDGSFDYPYLPDFLGAPYTPTGKYTYTAKGLSSNLVAYADLQVNIDNAPGNTQGISLSVTPGVDEQGSYFIFQGTGYLGGEKLALWLRYPDNSVGDLGQIEAGPSGVLYYVIRLNGAPVGHYAFTGYGLSSTRTGIAEFDLKVNDLTRANGVGQLQVGPSASKQRSFALFTGSGFAPKEIVSVWVTLPDYSTYALGDIKADENGAFAFELYLGEQEVVGKRSYTAYGNSSRVRAIAEYEVKPGGPTTSGAPEPNAVLPAPADPVLPPVEGAPPGEPLETPTVAPVVTPTAAPYPVY